MHLFGKTIKTRKGMIHTKFRKAVIYEEERRREIQSGRE